MRGGVLDPTPVAGLPQGITSTRRDTAGVDIAIHPRFAENRYIYVAYWKPSPGSDAAAKGTNIRTAVLIRARYDGGPTLSDVREIFASASWTDGPSAARLVFGRDGKIYMAIGAPGFATERGTTVWAQSPAEHGGKILRLNDDGTTPQDNPFVGRPGYKPEIFALGIRNAIGLTIHPETGELWETENGPQGGDEVNIIRAGKNYGWPTITYGRAYTNDPEGKNSGLPPPTIQPPTSAAGHGGTRHVLQAVDRDLGDGLLHGRQVPRPGEAISSSAGWSACSCRGSSSTARASKHGARRCCSNCASESATSSKAPTACST